MSPQGVVTRKKAYDGSGLSLVEGHKFCTGTQSRSRDELSCLPLVVTKASPLGPMLVGQPVTETVL